MALNLHCHSSSSFCNGRSNHQLFFCSYFHGQIRSFKPYLAWKHHQLFANSSSFYHFMAVSRLKGLRRSPQYQPLTICMAQTELGDIPDDYYAVLGVPSDATTEEIKKAYYSCMKACHPDLSGDDPGTTIFCMFVNEVYEVLSDPVQRMVYDEINGYSIKATNPFLDTSKPREHCFVDEFSCIGCKNCSNIAPLTFEIEEEFGRARVVSQSGERQLVQQAIDTCPVDCIHWVSAAQLSLLEDEMRKIERVNASVKTLEDCLNLLKGDSDERRLVGLLLATKFIQGDDTSAVIRVFEATGFQFIDRLLQTGRGNAQEQPYLQLALSILAAFCRVPELASLDEIISTVPVFMQMLAENYQGSIGADCYECLLGVALASEKGLICVKELRALPVISRHLRNSPLNAVWTQLAVKLMHLLLTKALTQREIADYTEDLALAVPTLVEHLAFEQSIVKFEILPLLCSLVASDRVVSIRLVLKSNEPNNIFFANLRTGIGQILHSRVVADHKHLAMELVEAVVELYGTSWLFGSMVLPGEKEEVPIERFFMLLVETLRMEAAVILNEVARMRFGSEHAEARNSESTSRMQHILAVSYNLLENIIDAIIVRPDSPSKCNEVTLEMTMVALNETIGVVFDFLNDAKNHGMMKGDDLLASVHLVGRFLADAPSAYRKQFAKLIQYLFSVTGENEERPFLSVHFLLPALSQFTIGVDGCKVLMPWKGYKQIIHYISVINSDTEHGINGLMIDACDILINLLQKRNEIALQIGISDFFQVLHPLASWAINVNKPMEIALAACICSLVLDFTDEDTLLKTMKVTSADSLSEIFLPMIKSMEQSQQSESMEDAGEDDLWDIVNSTCAGLIDRYPSLRKRIISSAWLQQRLQNGNLNEESIRDITTNPSLQILLSSLMIHST